MAAESDLRWRVLSISICGVFADLRSPCPAHQFTNWQLHIFSFSWLTLQKNRLNLGGLFSIALAHKSLWPCQTNLGRYVSWTWGSVSLTLADVNTASFGDHQLPTRRRVSIALQDSHRTTRARDCFLDVRNSRFDLSGFTAWRDGQKVVMMSGEVGSVPVSSPEASHS